MTAGGHDAYWMGFSVVIAALTVAFLAREGGRIVALRLGLRDLPVRNETPRSAIAAVAAGSSWRAEFRGLWPALFAATAVAFTILENLEHIAAGQSPHGL